MATQMTDTQPTRRAVLAALGSSAAISTLPTTGALAHDTDGLDHEICLFAPSDRLYPYSFSVTGTIRASDTPKHADLDPAHVTADAEDDIDDCVVHGWLAGGYDCFWHDGTIDSFDIPRKYADQYRIWVDGDEVRPHDLRTDTHPANYECRPASSRGDPDAWKTQTTQATSDESVYNYDCSENRFIHTLPCETDCHRSTRLENLMKVRASDPDCAWFRFKPEGACITPGGTHAGGVWATLSSYSGRSQLTGISFSGRIEYLELSNHDIEVKVNDSEWCSCDDFGGGA